MYFQLVQFLFCIECITFCIECITETEDCISKYNWIISAAFNVAVLDKMFFFKKTSFSSNNVILSPQFCKHIQFIFFSDAYSVQYNLCVVFL